LAIASVLDSRFSFHVERLRVTINELEGPIPTEIGRLTNLDVLDAGRNLLTGTIPTEIGLMANLNTLGLEDNRLNGTIPAVIGDLQDMRKFFCFKKSFLDVSSYRTI
jgi:Leucine-rich repeat (LRR) protein